MSAATSASAADWFVKVDGVTGNDGKSWETAFNLADAITAINSETVSTGDNVYFAGGTYYYPELRADGTAMVTGIKMQNKFVNLHGGYPTDLTGTAKPELSYPTATPTVLNGDTNRSGVPDDGDVRNLIFVQTTKASGLLSDENRSVLIEGFTLKGAYYNGTKGTELGAINCDMSRTVTIRHCTFTGNKCTNAGAAFSNSGSRTQFIDCVFEGNEGKDAGIAINQSKRGDADTYFRPAVMLERSLITGNKAVGEGGAGGSAIRINHGEVYILNSTITDNSGYHKGAIHMNTATGLYVFSSTIANNHDQVTTYGTGIYGTVTPTINLMNSYVVSDGADGNVPAIMVDAMTTPVKSVFTSDGGNIMGYALFTGTDAGFEDNLSDALVDGYDSYGTANTAKSLFGECALTDNGGYSKVLVPAESVHYFAPSDLKGMMASYYRAPFAVDETVDQRNVARQAVTAVGAYDDANNNTSVCDEIADNAARLRVWSVGNGVFGMSVVADNVTVYGMTGNVVAKAQKTDIVDLSALANGVYVIVADGNAAKVVR